MNMKLFDRIAPWLFVVIWSTGWISAKFGALHADALTFLSLRFALAGAVLLVMAIFSGSDWPKTSGQWLHNFFCGMLIHAVYLGSVWWAVAHGLPATISALIAAVQPILSTLLAPVLQNERVRFSRWLGVALGFFGLTIVLSPKLLGLAGVDFSALTVPIVINCLGMVSLTLGTFYQKRFVINADLRVMTALQYAGALAITLPAAFFLEPMHIDWTWTLILTMAWSVLALSLGAVFLLLLLIRHGAVSKAAVLIFLVPPTAAIQAYFLIGESLTLIQWAGMVVTALGVALAISR
jgi:drug/metabolite transporter (DMT)-like permease